MGETFIESLTGEQALQAILGFFDALPEGLWNESNKPSLERVGRLVEKAEDKLGGDEAALARGLRETDNMQEQEQAAKWALAELREIEQFRPYVEDAITAAVQPHLCPLVPGIGFALIWALAMAVRYKRKTTTVTVEKKSSGEVVTTHAQQSFSFHLREATIKGLPDLLAKAFPRFGASG